MVTPQNSPEPLRQPGHWVEKHLGKGMLFLLKLAVLVFIGFIGFAVYRAIKGDEVKIFGVQISPKKKEAIAREETIPLEVSKIDTPVVNKPEEPAQINKSDPPKTKSNQSTKKDTAVNIQGKNINTGTFHGIQGDNNVVNAPIQPHPDNMHIVEMGKEILDKATKVEIFYRSDSRMSNIFANELIDLFRQSGYSNVDPIIDLGNQMKSPKGIHKMKDRGDGVVRFFVNVEG